MPTRKPVSTIRGVEPATGPPFAADSWISHGDGIFDRAMQKTPSNAGIAAAAAAGRPLVPFEQLMLIDERPGHPMCFFLECMVAGPLEEHRLRAAVQTAARRHPRLSSRVGFRRGRAVWLEADVLPAFIWNPGEREGSPWRPLNLVRESGVRVVVLSDGADHHRVVMQVHHATCDGVAACEFFGDLWAVYAGIEPRDFSQPRVQRPRTADDHIREVPAADHTTDIARETWAFASFWPAALACVKQRSSAIPPDRPLAAASRHEPHAPPYRWLEFDPIATEQLRLAASADGVSLNDSIVAAVMRAVGAWNVRAGRRPGNVRVTMPVSLRQPGLREPANNTLGYAFLDRTAAECADRRSLTTSIAAATRWILENRAAGFFLGAIELLSGWPWLLRLTTRIPLCISTVVVSNIGDPSRRMRSGVGKIDGRDAPDDLTIQGFLGVPPLRPRTRAAIGVTTYAGRLSLCCLCSAGPDPHEAARQFLELVRQELLGFAEADGGRGEQATAHAGKHA